MSSSSSAVVVRPRTSAPNSREQAYFMHFRMSDNMCYTLWTAGKSDDGGLKVQRPVGGCSAS